MPKFLVVGGGNAWFWKLRGGNGEIMCHSEQFTRKSSAIRAAKRARALARFALLEVKDPND